MWGNSISQRIASRFVHGASTKRLRVFDFDDTLVSSKGSVSVVKSDGEEVEMDSATFAHYKVSKGDKLDFGAFNDVTNPRIIKANFDKFKEAIKRGDKVVILTARAKGSKSSVKKFLKDQDIDDVEVVALASSDPYDKARWIDKAIEEDGYDDVEFFDDSSANARAVAEYKPRHKGIHFESTNTPHPKEGDYAGPAIKRVFKSDDPTKAVVEIKDETETGTGKSQGSSAWWEEQTEAFKKNYCGEHENSRYCP
jgi:acid phosphatase class B